MDGLGYKQVKCPQCGCMWSTLDQADRVGRDALCDRCAATSDLFDFYCEHGDHCSRVMLEQWEVDGGRRGVIVNIVGKRGRLDVMLSIDEASRLGATLIAIAQEMAS